MEPPVGTPMSKSDEELEIQALRRVISAYLEYVLIFSSFFSFLELQSLLIRRLVVCVSTVRKAVGRS
jgi:hypothetical protein